MNPLANVPGLGGYIAGQEANQTQQAGQLQQAQGVMNLQKLMQDHQRETGFRSAIQELGANPTQEQLTQVSARFGSPKDVLATQQASLDRKDAAQARAESQKAILEQKAQQSEAALAERTRYNDMMHEFRMARAQSDADKAAELTRYNQAKLEFQQQNATLQAELKRQGLQSATDKAEATTAQAKGKQVQQLGTAMERAGLHESDATLRAVEDALGKNPAIAEYLSGPKSLLPDMMVPQEVRESRQAFNKLFNITLKNRSGSAVTNQELDRLKQEFATGAFKSPEQLKAAVSQMRNVLTGHYRGISAGFGPDVLEGYNQNLREMGGTPLLEAQQAAPTPQPTPGTPPPPPGFTLVPKPRGR